MSELFLELLNGSIAAGWLVLAVLMARIAMKKAPRWMVCALWIIVAVRLVLPGTIESPLSLVPSAQTIPPQSMYDRAPVIDSGVELVDEIINPVYTESFRTDGFASINPLQVWTAVAANIWILGMLAMAAWALASWLSIRRRVAERVYLTDNIYLCDRIDTPFIFGFLCPAIYLPSGLEEESRCHVIAHERAHLARRDHWWKPIGFVLLAIHWFHPLMWLAYILLCRDIEMACDEKVIRSLDTAGKKSYSAALLRCSVSPRMIAACPLAFGEVDVRTRIQSVLHYRKPALWVVVIALVLIAVLAVCFLTNPVVHTPVIRYDGVYYVADGSSVPELDSQFLTDADLVSVLHSTPELPDTDCQGTNLDWEYAGCAIYHNPGDEGHRFLYLQKPGGDGYLRFRLRTPGGLLRELVKSGARITVNVDTDNSFTTEDLTGDRKTAMQSILQNVSHFTFKPGSLESDGQVFLTVFPEGEIGKGLILTQGENGEWELRILDEEYGPSTWLLSNSELDTILLQYKTRAESCNAFFAGFDQKVQIAYRSFYDNGYALRVGIPYSVPEWNAEMFSPGWNEAYAVGFRCNPRGRDGIMTFCYFPEAEFYSSTSHQLEDFTCPNGVSGTRYINESTGLPEVIRLDTRSGHLAATLENTGDWTEQDWQIAEFILSTITLLDSNGTKLIRSSSTSSPVDLGIAMTAEDVTATGLTLVITQEGTPLTQLITGSFFSIDRWENGQWVNMPYPEGTAWTTVAYTVPVGETSRRGISWGYLLGSLPSGTYRVEKTFTGTLPNPGVMGYIPQNADQTCYAEFIID